MIMMLLLKQGLDWNLTHVFINYAVIMDEQRREVFPSLMPL